MSECIKSFCAHVTGLSWSRVSGYICVCTCVWVITCCWHSSKDPIKRKSIALTSAEKAGPPACKLKPKLQRNKTKSPFLSGRGFEQNKQKQLLDLKQSGYRASVRRLDLSLEFLLLFYVSVQIYKTGQENNTHEKDFKNAVATINKINGFCLLWCVCLCVSVEMKLTKRPWKLHKCLWDVVVLVQASILSLVRRTWTHMTKSQDLTNHICKHTHRHYISFYCTFNQYSSHQQVHTCSFALACIKTEK